MALPLKLAEVLALGPPLEVVSGPPLEEAATEEQESGQGMVRQVEGWWRRHLVAR